MTMNNPGDSDIDIGYVIEVNGERALIELAVDTTVPLGEDYYPGQPGSHVKIPLSRQSIIGIVAGVRMEAGAPLCRPDCGEPGTARRIAECILIGTLGDDGSFVRGVAVYPNVGQAARMVTHDEIRKIFAEFMDFGFSFGRPVHALDQRAYVQVDKLFGHHVAVLGSTGCGKSCTTASMLQAAVRHYPDTHIVVLDLHGEYAAAFPENVLKIGADEVELPFWLLNFEEFSSLSLDQSEDTAKNQITVLRDSIVRARENAEVSERLGLGKDVTVDSPIYYDINDLLGQVRAWNMQMVSNPKGELMPGPLHGAFDRFLIRFESRVNDPRYAFMFAPQRYQDSSSLPQMLRDFLSIDSEHRMCVIDLSGVPSEAVAVVAAVVSRVIFEFNLWNPEREKFPILLVLEEAHNYIPNVSDPRSNIARVAVERIAKEGRKYGTGMVVVSQRPKDLSETVL
ncbi:ATP-binding protein, partial [candidate division WOR-3 bacterium]|nr:ATP-binding protein [candidate division WOR-3 bacterium]